MQINELCDRFSGKSASNKTYRNIKIKGRTQKMMEMSGAEAYEKGREQ
jgi:hypothetical protein